MPKVKVRLRRIDSNPGQEQDMRLFLLTGYTLLLTQDTRRFK